MEFLPSFPVQKIAESLAVCVAFTGNARQFQHFQRVARLEIFPVLSGDELCQSLQQFRPSSRFGSFGIDQRRQTGTVAFFGL